MFCLSTFYQNSGSIIRFEVVFTERRWSVYPVNTDHVINDAGRFGLVILDGFF